MKLRKTAALAAIVCGLSLAVLFLLVRGLSADTRAAPPPAASGGMISTLYAGAASSRAPAIRITPDQMQLGGDVTTRANCANPVVCAWVNGAPAGSIILGMDPASLITRTWDGGSATAQLYIGDILSPTVGTVSIAWPDRDGRGLRSPLRGQVAAISFDGHVIWDQRTENGNAASGYYGAEHEPIRFTFVVTRSITHTLAIVVPPQTAWDISEITVDLSPMPAQIRGLAYSPYRDCQTPRQDDLAPTLAEIGEDMPRLFHAANAIRTYSALYPISDIPALAHQWGLRVTPGAWLDEDADRNADEIRGLIQIANTVPVESVIVGNEALVRRDLSVPQLIAYINQVRAGVPPNVEVTTADTDGVWLAEWYPKEQIDALVNAVDYITIHIYPYWRGQSIAGAAARVLARYRELQSIYPHKRIVIGETGWPSAGQTNGQAVPSEENQYRFYREFLALAEQAGVEFYYFDPFDELWKRSPSREQGGEGEAGAHWGLGYADRTAKHGMWGVLLSIHNSRTYLPTILVGMNNIHLAPSGLMSVAGPASDRPGSAGGRTDPATPTGKTHRVPSETDLFPVYTEWNMPDNHFAPSGGFGDVGDIDVYQCERSDPHSGELAIRVTYTPAGALGWAGTYWQEPGKNWGTLPGGYDLSSASRLVFWVKGGRGGEKVRFFVGGIGVCGDPYPDSLRPAISTDVLALTPQWRKVEIDLRGRDLSHVIGGFGWAANQGSNSGGITFYLDDITFVSDPGPAVTPTPTPRPAHAVFPVYTDYEAPGNHYSATGWMGTINDIHLDEAFKSDVHSGSTAIRIRYSPFHDPWWAGIYWLDPAENWADRPGGQDLSGARRVTFWAKSPAAGTRVEFFVGGVGYLPDTCTPQPTIVCRQYLDSLCPAVKQTFTLSNTWQPYRIDLPSGRDLRRVVGGFGWSAASSATFYLDDIVWEFDN